MDGDTYKVKADFSEIDAAIARAIEKFGAFTVGVIEDLNEINDVVINTLSAGFQKAGQTIVQSFQYISAGASAAFDAITAAAKAMWAAITGGFTAVTGFIGSAFSAVLSPIKTVFSGIWGAAKTAAGYITGFFKSSIGFVKGLFSDLYGVVKELLPLVGVGLGVGLATGFKELQATEAAMTRVSAAVKATGGVAGFTSDQLKAMADEMAETTRFGDDVALSAQSVALQFKNVRGDIFAQTLKTGADAAIAWGTDLSSATEKVARALDDPLEGFRLLKAEGTKFSSQEKELIERMVEFGDVAGAQRIILGKLAQEVGGQASADLNTFGGMLAQVNNAMGDAWKAIAGALVPAMKQVVTWFKAGADTMASWAPVLGALTNDFIAWANKSSGTFAEWGTKAQEIFLKTFNFVVDAATRAFSFVQTAIQDFPGFMEAAKAKFDLYWEQIKQTIVGTWEIIAIEVEHVWDKMIAAMQNSFQSFTNRWAKTVANLPGFAKAFGITQEDLNETLEEMQNAQQEFVAGPRRKAKGPSQDELDRLAMLKKAADEAGGAFGEKFEENYNRNKETVDKFIQRVKELTGLQLSPQDLKPTLTGEGFTLNKEEQGKDTSKAGGFEDLLALQKRIAGATAAQTPEARAMVSLPGIIKQQHAEKKAQKDKEIADKKQADREQKQLLSTINDNLGLA